MLISELYLDRYWMTRTLVLKVDIHLGGAMIIKVVLYTYLYSTIFLHNALYYVFTCTVLGQGKCCCSGLNYKKSIVWQMYKHLVINIAIWFIRPLEVPPTLRYTT